MASQVSHRSLGNTKTRDRSRAWCLTINNFTEEDVSLVKKTFDKWVIGREHELPVIEDDKIRLNVTPHLQIFGKSNNQISFSTLKKIFPRAHIEKARGSTDSNFKYCTKDNYYETNIELNEDRERRLDKLLFDLFRGCT